MCGFAAVVGLHGKAAERSTAVTMAASMVHRGPDEGGVYASGPVALGFRRLRILDLSPAGSQPMESDDGQHVIVFNGEIFNYVELRDDLRARGHRFRSTGDTEVLLAAYREWGADCLHRLNGMWAFLVWDRRRQTLFGARDRFGVKPLYLHRTPTCLLFASEIKAIGASGHYQPSPDWSTAARFLLEERLDEGTETFYAGVERIPSGTAFEVDTHGAFRQWRYWSLAHLPRQSIDDPVRPFAELFEDAVRLRMRSDVPVGVSLSGGLDSTSIACAAARHRGDCAADSTHPLTAFSYASPEFDESAYIADTVSWTGIDFKQVQVAPVSLWDELPSVLRFHDEPVHSMTALIGFRIMRAASASGVKVVLNGQGADETLGGYPSYFRNYWYTLLRRGDLGRLWTEVNAHAALHGGSARALLGRLFRRVVQSELWRAGGYRGLVAWGRRRQARRHPWFSPDLADHLAPADREPLDLTLDGALLRSVEQSPLPLYLRIEDRNSMAHSVEARVPFLDYRLVSLAFNLREEWKTRGPWNKYVLREAMRGRIPESVRTRPDKMGFPVPSRTWLAGDLSTAVLDLLGDRSFHERGIFRADAIRRDLERHRRGEIDVSQRLFNIIEFEVWSRVA
ncbi:MAG: asparagine synthase (glutamine-hydrolyzing) [Candidatus Rokubacteria bacterium]|nr:asparagine synthase (glutamine-hydrolyzing) [Candidatus Rokubacteria bacterium]